MLQQFFTCKICCSVKDIFWKANCIFSLSYIQKLNVGLNVGVKWQVLICHAGSAELLCRQICYISHTHTLIFNTYGRNLLSKLVTVFVGCWSTYLWSYVNHFDSFWWSFYSGYRIPLASTRIQVSTKHFRVLKFL